MKDLLNKYTDEEIKEKIDNFLENLEFIIINERMGAIEIPLSYFVILLEQYNKNNIFYLYSDYMKLDSWKEKEYIINIEKIPEGLLSVKEVSDVCKKIEEHNEKIKNYTSDEYKIKLQHECLNKYGEDKYEEKYEEIMNNLYSDFIDIEVYTEINGRMHCAKIQTPDIEEETDELNTLLSDLILKYMDVLNEMREKETAEKINAMEKEFEALDKEIKSDPEFQKCTNQSLRRDYRTKHFDKKFKKICPVAYSIYEKYASVGRLFSASEDTEVSIYMYQKVGNANAYLDMLYKEIKNK